MIMSIEDGRLLTSEPRIGDGMDEVRDHLRALIASLRAKGRIDHLNDWCRKAGFPNAANVTEFLAGNVRAPTIKTFMALAAAVELPVSAVIGDAVDRDALITLVDAYLADADERERFAFRADLLRAMADDLEQRAEQTPPADPEPLREWRARAPRRAKTPRPAPEEGSEPTD